MAVALLAGLGYTVEAVTGRASEADYLKELGATTIVDRGELTGKPRVLAKERWAAGVDAVGGAVLANVLSMTTSEGAIAACGNAAGLELNTTVAPFILRGVSLLGINSVYQPKARRIEAWNRLAGDLDRGKLAKMTTDHRLRRHRRGRARHRRRQGARPAGGEDRLVRSYTP